MQLTLDSPKVVHSLVLLEPALVTRKPSWAEASSQLLAPAFELYKESPRDAAEMLLSGVEGRRWREFADTFPGGSAQWVKDTVEMFFEFSAALDWSFDAKQGVRISQPVLHITGANSPPYVETLKRLFKSWVPQTEGVVIPGAWHGMHMRQPDAVAREIADFLAGHLMVT